MLSQYIDHLEHERGFSPVTIQLSRQRITEFLGRVCYPDRSLRDLTVIDIDQAIAQKTRQDGCSRVSVQSYVYTLRSFFRYAESRGQCASGLAKSLVSPRIFQGESLPAGPSWKDVQRLLSESEGDSRAEIRARAALLLFAVYGLRVGEVRRLRLQDLDWERELLIINRSKQQLRTQTYPLQQIVGDAILRYLREARPNCQHREVFVSLKAPIKPLSKTAFWQDINTIRAWLGHVSINTTNVYADVDLEMKAKALAHCEVASTKTSTKRWRNDEGLMAFLRSL